MKLLPTKLPKRIRVLIQEIESGESRKGKPGTIVLKSKTYQILEITFEEFNKRFVEWMKNQS